MDELAAKPRTATLYERQPYGPVHVHIRQDEVAAEGPAGTASLPRPPTGDRLAVREMALGGVTIRFEGEPLLQVHQTEHGWRRGRRLLHLRGPEWVPRDAYFRARGWTGRPVLYGPSGRLIDAADPVTRSGRRRLALAEGVGPELVAVFTVVRSALSEALTI